MTPLAYATEERVAYDAQCETCDRIVSWLCVRKDATSRGMGLCTACVDVVP